MKTKLIQIKDYLLLIDEEVICKTGELYLTSIQNRIIPKSKGVIQAGDKIIAYYPLTKEAKKLDLPELPPFEGVDVERLAEEYLQKWRGLNNVHLSNRIHADRCKNDFIAGYKAAQSNKQFTLEDMKKAIEYTRRYNQHSDEWIINEIIKSLSTQQLPKEFIPEYKDEYISNGKIVKSLPISSLRELKTITNSEGKQELVGEYKY